MKLDEIVREIHRVAEELGIEVESSFPFDGFVECVRVRLILGEAPDGRMSCQDVVISEMTGEYMVKGLSDLFAKAVKILVRLEIPRDTGKRALKEAPKSHDYWFPVVTCW